MTDDGPGLSVRTFIVGLCMGTADAVPGVSGGTIALLAGIYERLIDALTAVGPDSASRALRAIVTLDVAEFRDVFEAVDGWFLGTLGVGLISALVLVARAVHYLEVTHPIALFGFFFGLILASAVVLAGELTLTTRRHAVAAVAGFTVAFVLSGDVALLSGHSLALTFLAGTIAISAMILPGISGALILIILGQYTYLTTTLSSFTDALIGLATGGAVAQAVDLAATVIAFVVGALVGLFTIARLVDRALDADYETTMAFLVALVVGALRAPITEISTRETIAWTTDTILEFALVAAVGAVFLFALDHYAVDIDLDGVDDPDSSTRTPATAAGEGSVDAEDR